jgi:hypothetical protein
MKLVILVKAKYISRKKVDGKWRYVYYVKTGAKPKTKKPKHIGYITTIKGSPLLLPLKGFAAFDVYANPSAEDMDHADKGFGLRVIADSRTKTLYVADAGNALHMDVVRGLHLTPWDTTYDVYDGSRFLLGMADKKKGRWVAGQMDARPDEETRNRLRGIDWSWTEQLIPGLQEKAGLKR